MYWNRLKDWLKNHIPYWKLESNILIIFLVLFITSFVIFFSYSYEKNKKEIIHYADSLIEQYGRETSQSINSLLIDIRDLTETEKTMVTTVDQVSLDNKTLINYMFDALRKTPNLGTLFMTNTKGTYIGLIELQPHTHYQKKPAQFLPATYKYALLFVDRKGSTPKEKWLYFDAKNLLHETEEINSGAYDVRNTSWFQSALKLKIPNWTHVFRLFVTHNPGFIYTYPIFDNKGEIIAVAGGSVELLLLSNFMKSHKVSSEQSSILFAKDGSILASSEELLGNKTINIKDNPLTNKAYQIFLQEHKRNYLLDFEGVEYVVSLSPFVSETKKELYLLIMMPSEHLLKQIRDTQKDLYFMLFFIVIGAIIIAVIFSKRISKPIVALSGEIDRLQRLDLEEEIVTTSHIKEIHHMTRSLIALQSALRSLSAYVPKEQVRMLLKAGRVISLGGKKQELTIMFTDIRDFTTISESSSTVDLIKQLEEYFKRLSSIILQHQGTIDKYMGDGIMAFWGAPEKVKNHAYLAAESALLLQQALNEMNPTWAKQGKPIFYTRIGLHTGKVFVGNIGTPERMNYTIVGDAVNLASRLEGINKMYKITITVSEPLAKLISDDFLLRPIDVVNVKGRNEKVKIFELVAKLSDESTTKEMVQFCSSFKEAFEVFEQKDLAKALILFQAIYKKYPDDLPTQLYIERLLPFLTS